MGLGKSERYTYSWNSVCWQDDENIDSSKSSSIASHQSGVSNNSKSSSQNSLQIPPSDEPGFSNFRHSTVRIESVKTYRGNPVQEKDRERKKCLNFNYMNKNITEQHTVVQEKDREKCLNFIYMNKNITENTISFKFSLLSTCSCPRPVDGVSQTPTTLPQYVQHLSSQSSLRSTNTPMNWRNSSLGTRGWGNSTRSSYYRCVIRRHGDLDLILMVKFYLFSKLYGCREIYAFR